MSIRTAKGRSALRKRLDLSRSQLAAFLGVSEATIVRWEDPADTAPKGLHAMVLEALEQALGTSSAANLRALVIQGAYDNRSAVRELLNITGRTQ